MKKFLKYFGFFLILSAAVLLFFYFRYMPSAKVEWGITFSYQEAQGLGFNPRQTFLEVLSDLKPKKLRLMTYWKDLERTRGSYDFSNIDWQLEQAKLNNIGVLLVLGRKQPRWPECSEPDWVKKLPGQEQDQALLDFVRASTVHFKTFDVIKEWQVENEPFFNFGPDCPVSSEDQLLDEIDIVKQIDSRPIVVTDSGERGSWLKSAGIGADILGATLYRVSFDPKYGGYYKYPIPAVFYRIKAGFLQTFRKTSDVWDVELQMEPWFTGGAFNTSLDIQRSLMNPKVFADNVQYAKATQLSRHYLWGVEWWYWMAKKNNDWGMWNAAKDLFAQ
ncbi:MAG: hypothetical protein ABI643_02800 [Candidatus Doudnabacteria bacterium]